MKFILSNIYKEYEFKHLPKKVLNDINLTLQPGEIIAVVGSNGCGKTTLINLLAGLIQPTRGTIEYIPDVQDYGKTGIAVLWQNYRESNFPWLNALDNVALSGVFGRHDQEQARIRAANILQDLLPEVNPGAKVYGMSGGQQQILALARALASEPRAVLADEALSAIDQARNWLLLSRFETWWLSRRIPVLWVSHNLDETILIADKVLLLSVSSGRIVDTLMMQCPRPRSTVILSSDEATVVRRRLVNFLKGEEEWRLKNRQLQ